MADHFAGRPGGVPFKLVGVGGHSVAHLVGVPLVGVPLLVVGVYRSALVGVPFKLKFKGLNSGAL